MESPNSTPVSTTDLDGQIVLPSASNFENTDEMFKNAGEAAEVLNKAIEGQNLEKLSTALEGIESLGKVAPFIGAIGAALQLAGIVPTEGQEIEEQFNQLKQQISVLQNSVDNILSNQEF